MNKIWFIIGGLLALVACAKPMPVVSPPVSHEDCQKLYTHLQFIAVVNDVDPELELSTKDFDGAMWEVDQQWQVEGKTERFFRACPQMTKRQFNCAMNAIKSGDVTTCIRLGKKHD